MRGDREGGEGRGWEGGGFLGVFLKGKAREGGVSGKGKRRGEKGVRRKRKREGGTCCDCCFPGRGDWGEKQKKQKTKKQNNHDHVMILQQTKQKQKK